MNVSMKSEIEIPATEAETRPRRRPAGRTGCGVEATLSVVGGVWKPVLLFHLLRGKLRFNALCRLTPRATQRMITLQLRELENDGVLRRIVYPEVPPKVEYELTEFGRSLEPVLLSMRAWGEAFQARMDGPDKPARTC